MTDTITPEPKTVAPPPQAGARASATRLGFGIAGVSAVAGSLRPGLGLAIGLLALLVAAVMVVGPRTWAGLWCASWGLAVPWLIIRDNRWLAICIVATAVAVAVLAFTARASGQSLSDFSIGRIIRRSARPNYPSAPMPELSVPRHMLAVLRGLLLAAPVLWAFGSLLSSADSVFAALLGSVDSVFSSLLSFNVGSSVSISILNRPAWFIGLALVAVPVLRFGADRRTSTSVAVPQRVGTTETSIVFGSVCALFALFITSRLSSFGREFGGELLRDEVRGGFFQLLWVAALTVALVLVARLIGGEALNTWRVRSLALLTIALAAVIDVLALVRIAGYVRDSFSTPLRVWSFGFGVWLLVVLAIAAVRVLGVQGQRRWFTVALLTSWMGFVVAMGLFNPDEWIATYNFENAPTEPDQFIAVNPLIWLSDDGTEVIIENIEVLRPMPNDRFDRVVAHLCETPSSDSWRDFNLSRSGAAGSIDDLCGRQ